MLAKGFSVPELQHPALPVPPSWFPLPPGWTLLAVILLALLLTCTFLRLARYRRNRWRREARQALSAVHNADEWLQLIKRILLVHHARPDVSQWQTSHELLQQLPLDEMTRVELSQRYCQRNAELEPALNQHVREQVSQWLEGLPDV